MELSPAQGRRPAHRPGVGTYSPASSSFCSSMSIVPSELTQEVPLIHFLISGGEVFQLKALSLHGVPSQSSALVNLCSDQGILMSQHLT